MRGPHSLKRQPRAHRATAAPPPSVSVVICTYLREESLRNLLLDISAQDVSPEEVIVIDQTPEHEPSTDALLRALAPLVQHHRQAVPNLPAARNRGIQVASGEVLLFVDDDVRLPRAFVAGVRSMFSNTTIDALAPLVISDNWHVGRAEEIRYGLRGAWIAQPFIAVNSAIGACMAIRRDVIELVGGFDEALGHLHPSASGEDVEFTRRLTRRGFVLALTPALRVVHESERPGGCRNREIVDTSSSRRAVAYITLKEGDAFERMTVAVIAQLLRSYFIRRDVILSFPRIRERFRALVTDVAAIRHLKMEGQLPSGGSACAVPGE